MTAGASAAWSMPPRDLMDGAEEDKVVMALLAVQVEAGILLARSHAKRVAHRFERFSRVELDFTGVSEIGRAFADELFRVFAAAHPAIRITPINTQPAVEQMMRRAVAAGWPPATAAGTPRRAAPAARTSQPPARASMPRSAAADR